MGSGIEYNGRLVCKRKEKGIYFNSESELSESHVELFLKIFNSANYKFLSKFYQSIHHINIYKYDEDTYDSLIIKFRKHSIKPEDIDVEMLKGKEGSGSLSEYERLLLYMASKKKVYYTKEEIEEKRIIYQRKVDYWNNKISELDITQTL